MNDKCEHCGKRLTPQNSTVITVRGGLKKRVHPFFECEPRRQKHLSSAPR